MAAEKGSGAAREGARMGAGGESEAAGTLRRSTTEIQTSYAASAAARGDCGWWWLLLLWWGPRRPTVADAECDSGALAAAQQPISV